MKHRAPFPVLGGEGSAAQIVAAPAQVRVPDDGLVALVAQASHPHHRHTVWLYE